MSEHDSGTGTQIRRGDADGLANFIEQHRGQLTAFLQKRTGAHLRIKIEPEDIFQEVVADALRAVAQDDWEPCEPLHWLYALCERRIIDAHRRYFAAQKRSAAREAKLGSSIALEDLLVASMTTPSAAFSRNQKELAMLAAIATLPTEQQDALRMRYLQGLPSKDIAKKLDKSDGAVRVMLSRGIARLQTLLDVH
jgi:RNA polymerase sigma-70 factor (ECF subfamily)